ncbi:MAG: hypothetical protein Q8Q08_12130 [Candidatus Omnitrophota bacterium]|nr:hypothetical protein [Candidatus Omnitrophota bacterium]MDZ4241628.1 hypothetical protein [Candidatus Omnitrophota bacterium]
MTQSQLQWETGSSERFNRIIARIPVFHREIAKQVVQKKAELNAAARGAAVVADDDIIAAFFSEVPKAFYSLMIRLLDESGFNYREHQQREGKK